MPEYKFTVLVNAEDRAKAERVIAERIYHDEDYGFPYTIEVAGVANDPGKGE